MYLFMINVENLGHLGICVNDMYYSLKLYSPAPKQPAIIASDTIGFMLLPRTMSTTNILPSTGSSKLISTVFVAVGYAKVSLC